MGKIFPMGLSHKEGAHTFLLVTVARVRSCVLAFSCNVDLKMSFKIL